MFLIANISSPKLKYNIKAYHNFILFDVDTQHL